MRRLGPYELLEALGRGAAATVYRAREEATGRSVALKVVARPEDPVARERFLREGAILAALRHPGILEVHAAGSAGGRLYLATALVEGARTLDRAWQGAPLEQRVSWVRDAARALGHAHRRGIVHRDVKPANLLVDEAGRLRVADFGLATATELERLTRTGLLVGTPVAMAPEQFAGKGRVTPATDVWGLGVVLYEALTGELPFEASDLLGLARRVASGEFVPPGERRPALPASLCAVCEKALRVDPRERYADGNAFAADLERALAGKGVRSGWSSLRRIRLRQAVGALTLVASLGLLGASAFAWWQPVPREGRNARPSPRRPSGGNPPQRGPAPPAAGTDRARAGGLEPPSGRSPSAAGRSRGGAKPSGPVLRRRGFLPHAANDVAFVGERLAATAGEARVVLWELADPPRIRWEAPCRQASAVLWLPRRQLLAVASRGGVRFRSLAGRSESASALKTPTAKDFVFSLAVSPDERRLAFATRKRLYLYDLDDGRRLLRTRLPENPMDLTFAADGGSVIACWGGSHEVPVFNTFLRVYLDGRQGPAPPGGLGRPNCLLPLPAKEGRGLWVGFDTGGVALFSPAFEHLRWLEAAEREASAGDGAAQRPQAYLLHLAHEGPIHGLARLPAGRLLTLCGGDRTRADGFRVWGPGGELLYDQPHPEAESVDLRRLALSPNRRSALVVDRGRRVEWWSVTLPGAVAPEARAQRDRSR